jgi:hypothetical protein
VSDSSTAAVPYRIEVRLDDKRREKLAQMLAAGRGRLSDIARHAIDLAYEEFEAEERLQAARDLVEMEIEDVPDPDELSRQLGETYSTPLP